MVYVVFQTLPFVFQCEYYHLIVNKIHEGQMALENAQMQKRAEQKRKENQPPVTRTLPEGVPSHIQNHPPGLQQPPHPPGLQQPPPGNRFHLHIPITIPKGKPIMDHNICTRHCIRTSFCQ